MWRIDALEGPPWVERVKGPHGKIDLKRIVQGRSSHCSLMYGSFFLYENHKAGRVWPSFIMDGICALLLWIVLGIVECSK